MKKLLLLIAIAMCSVSLIHAQSFKKGDNVAGAHVGFGGGYGVPVSVTYERGVYDINKDMSIGVGGILGYGGTSEKLPEGKWSFTNILIGARGAYHYTGVKKLDLLAGLSLGYDVASSKWTGSTYSGSSASVGGFFWGIYAGARYYFTDKFGANAEVGYGLCNFNIGVSYKF